LTLWDAEQIMYAQRWKAKEHVIFAVDVRVVHSKFTKSFAVHSTSKSIFCMNPEMREAEQLFANISNICIEDLNIVTDASFNSLTAREVTIGELKQHVYEHPSFDQFMIKATLSQFDVDGDRVVSTRCKFCHSSIFGDNRYCTNSKCQALVLAQDDPNEINIVQAFDIQVSISDHTGTIEHVRLAENLTDKWLKCSPEQFLQYTEEEKTSLKWKYLLEKFMFGVTVKTNSKDPKQQTYVKIVYDFPLFSV